VTVPIWLSLINTALVDCSAMPSDESGVGHIIVVADDVDAVTEPCGPLAKACPIVLAEAVLE
jgi:fructose-specific component phosphotransferase system IIB-like protein